MSTPAPVGVDATACRGTLLVGGCVHRSGDERVDAIGTDDDRRAFLDDGAARVAATDAHDSAVFNDELLDGEAGAHFGARFGSGIREQRVEDRAANAHDRVDATRTAVGVPSSTTGPKSNLKADVNGAPVARTRSSRPHRSSLRDTSGLDRMPREHIAREASPDRARAPGGPCGPGAWRSAHRRSGFQ